MASCPPPAPMRAKGRKATIFDTSRTLLADVALWKAGRTCTLLPPKRTLSGFVLDLRTGKSRAVIPRAWTSRGIASSGERSQSPGLSTPCLALADGSRRALPGHATACVLRAGQIAAAIVMQIAGREAMAPPSAPASPALLSCPLHPLQFPCQCPAHLAAPPGRRAARCCSYAFGSGHRAGLRLRLRLRLRPRWSLARLGRAALRAAMRARPSPRSRSAGRLPPSARPSVAPRAARRGAPGAALGARPPSGPPFGARRLSAWVALSCPHRRLWLSAMPRLAGAGCRHRSRSLARTGGCGCRQCRAWRAQRKGGGWSRPPPSGRRPLYAGHACPTRLSRRARGAALAGKIFPIGIIL